MQQNISFSEFEGKTDQNKKKKHLQTGVTTAFEKCPFVHRQADISFIYIQLVSLFGKSNTEARHSKLKCPPLVNAITNALNLQSLSPPLESVHKLFWFYTVSFMYIKTTPYTSYNLCISCEPRCVPEYCGSEQGKIHHIRQESDRKSFFWNLDFFLPMAPSLVTLGPLRLVRVLLLFTVPTVKVVTCSCEIKCKKQVVSFASFAVKPCVS